MPEADAPGSAALDGPIENRTPLYSLLAVAAVEHPGEPLPRDGAAIIGHGVEVPEPIGPLEAGTGPGRGRLDTWQAPRLTRNLRWFFEQTSQDRAALRQLYPELIGIGPRVAQLAVEATAPGRDPKAARRLGGWLARRGGHHGPVHVGLWLLAEAGTAADREVISTLGLAGGAFNPAAVQALRDTQPDPDRAVFALARRLKDWGLVYAVEALEGTTDPEIKRWMVRGACGDWSLIYFCHTVATTGDLLSALREGPVDDRLLDNAGAILQNLCAPDVQTTDINGYRDARAVLALHQRHVGPAAATLVRLHHLVLLEQAVHSGRAAGLDWDYGERESLLNGYAEILDRPVWTGVVEAGLAESRSGLRHFASKYAQRVGFDITGWMLDELRSETPDRGLYWSLLGGCDDARLPDVVAALRSHLTRPRGEMGRAIAEYALESVLPRLADSPGVGDDLLDYAAKSNRIPLIRAARELRRGRD